MKITEKDVNHAAHLARLELSNEETQSLTGDLNSILDYIDKLSELDTKNVEPTYHAVPVTNAFREDKLAGDFSLEDALANAPDAEDGSFKVPKVIE